MAEKDSYVETHLKHLYFTLNFFFIKLHYVPGL